MASVHIAHKHHIPQLTESALRSGRGDQRLQHMHAGAAQCGGRAHEHHEVSGPRERHVDALEVSHEAHAALAVAPHERDHDSVRLRALEAVHRGHEAPLTVATTAAVIVRRRPRPCHHAERFLDLHHLSAVEGDDMHSMHSRRPQLFAGAAHENMMMRIISTALVHHDDDSDVCMCQHHIHLHDQQP